MFLKRTGIKPSRADRQWFIQMSDVDRIRTPFSVTFFTSLSRFSRHQINSQITIPERGNWRVTMMQQATQSNSDAMRTHASSVRMKGFRNFSTFSVWTFWLHDIYRKFDLLAKFVFSIKPFHSCRIEKKFTLRFPYFLPWQHYTTRSIYSLQPIPPGQLITGYHYKLSKATKPLQTLTSAGPVTTNVNFNSLCVLTEFNVVCKEEATSLRCVECSGVYFKSKKTNKLFWYSEYISDCWNSFVLTFCDISCINIKHAWLWNGSAQIISRMFVKLNSFTESNNSTVRCSSFRTQSWGLAHDIYIGT